MMTSQEIAAGRSSTRRHAPPGGQSSFSINWGNENCDSVKLVGGKVTSAPTPSKKEPQQDTVVEEMDIKLELVDDASEQQDSKEVGVGLVVVKSEASGHAIDCTTKALAKAGIVKVVLVEIAHSSMLVGAAKKMLNTPGIHGVLALFLAPAYQQAHASNQEVALLQLGNMSPKPVIPGIICQSSLLEANGVLPNLAEDWAASMASLLSQDDYSSVPAIEPVKVIPDTPTEDILDPEELLDIYRECLKKFGARGIFGLQRKFKIIDDDNSKSICRDEFSKAIEEAALTWTDEQKGVLFDHFDRDKNGSISFDEFLCTVRGKLNESRKRFVLMAFELLDADKNGVLEVSDISSKYDASKHPDVISGKRSTNEVLQEFLDTFDGAEKDGKVTIAEFCEYYSNLSASIDDDDYFELMMRNAWHISGGEGWCSNTSCRRVLVTHTDGRQTVEELKNDLGISEEDEEAILANLASQGISDVSEVELNSGKKLKAAPVIQDSSSTASSPPPSPQRLSRRHANSHSGSSTLVLG